MWEFLDRFFGGGFMPHGHCYLWALAMVWTQVTSNTLIGVAYLSISSTLAYLVWRVKLPFSWVYIAFGLFILACGLTHFLDVATVWHPIYWADAGVRVVTAAASVGTAVLVFPLVPRVVALTKVSRLAKDRGEKLEETIVDLRRALDETKRYRLLVESVKDATFILDPTGHVVTWNAAAQRMKGYDAKEIVGKHFSSFYPEEDKGTGKPERELEVATGEGLFEEEGWRIRKDGSRFWAGVTLTAMRNEAGDLVGFAKVTRDLTERARNEERLRRLARDNAALEARAEVERAQRVQREFLAEAGAALASSLDYRTTLTTVSDLAVPELADWSTVELLEPGATASSQVALAHVDPNKVKFARELAERYPPDPNARTGVPEVIRSGKSILYSELPQALLEAGARDNEHLRILRELRLESAMVVPLTGRERVLGAMTFIYAASGRRYTESDLAFFEDFARRAAMAIENAQAHAAVRMTLEFQERFVAVLGHDLRNPLSSIDMAVGVLRQRAVVANDTPTVRVLDRMRTSSARMERMIEQILDLTRIRLGGGLDVRPRPMDLCEPLTAVVEECRASFSSVIREVVAPQ
jgi:PAS domain S-box-containing protein